MNRPRNRQGRGGGRPAQQTGFSVPTKEQVVPGASVFIVLKQDQPSGRETAGTVQEILTRGDHPRGIKVRLRDGRVGRVRRMSGPPPPPPPPPGRAGASHTDTPREAADAEDRAMPRDRTLADFLPASASATPSSPLVGGGAVVACPVCGTFQGDETAVTHHVERDHFS
ncbi:hypothetical protein L249_8289 [Ophiocordyceps polyrhachis-furcata BCC 54312]|uniref:UBZ4-type domain-containing protein n=1 Tax=Ophiocordyceps polyrhachis-furcata BCC 54312 TaxID=1330021 RepID=A0A367LH81_9HYPO|nr:hypothetical protein L249_8289 [Ophiocordyceps polyrhachis-furcata BCC 54312]